MAEAFLLCAFTERLHCTQEGPVVSHDEDRHRAVLAKAQPSRRLDWAGAQACPRLGRLSVASVSGQYRFGDFVLDTTRAQLLRDGREIALRPKSFDLLRYLVAHPDRLILKDELMAELWPNVVVTDDSLTRCISEVREALGDRSQSAIRTVPRRGYRFMLPVRTLQEPGVAPVQSPSAGRRPDQDPGPLPPIGRDADLAALDALAHEHRLVSLVGPGGVGKSRLARWWLWLHRDDADDGMAWVDLAFAGDAEALIGSVAAAFGASVAGSDGLRSLLAAVGHLKLTVVLDNAEHLIAEVAHLAEALHGHARGLRVLVTSQAPLGLAGEAVLRLAPLDLPPVGTPVDKALGYGALELLVQRARAADARFVLTEQNVAAAIEVCRRLDGMPLAIELAAARLPLFGMAGLANVLDERLRVLVQVGAQARDAPPRHRTLNAAMHWSHSLLASAEQALFRRLAVFAGTFTLDLAQQVAAGPVVGAEVQLDGWGVADALASLIERSLVAAEPADPPRWRLLETARLFAQQCLDASGEAAALRQRHARVTRERFERARRELLGGQLGFDDWRAARMPELPDARSAFEWACSHDAETAIALAAAIAHLQAGEFAQECRAMIERTEGLLSESLAPQARARWLHQAALAFAAEQPARAHRWAQEAVDLHRSLGDTLELYLALCAYLYWRPQSEDPAEAARHADEVARIERPDWPASVRAEGANALACWLVDERRFDEALEARRRSVQLLQRCGHAVREVRVQASLLDSLLGAGCVEEAIERGRELVGRLAGSRIIGNVPALRLNFAAALLRRGADADLEQAHEIGRQSWPQAIALDWQAYWADYLAQLAAQSGRARAAAQLLGYSDAGYRKLGAHRDFNEQHAAQRAADLAIAALGEDEFAALRHAGETLSDDDIAAIAFGTDEGTWVASMSAGVSDMH